MYRPALTLKRRRARIEMLPLIDVFFLLLAFFVFGVFSMRMRQGIDLRLPQAATAEATERETLTLSLDTAGTVYWEGQPVAFDVLAARLRGWREGFEAAPQVVVQADEGVLHSQVVALLDATRMAGIALVSFQTEPRP